MANEKPLVLVTDENGCITPTSHALNQDGYFRKWIPEKKRMLMYHIWVWMNQVGEIPEGYEINHKCKNRACCNVDHLECISGIEHVVLTNAERYAPRKEAAKAFWLSTGANGFELGERFGVTFSTGYKWIRDWKKEVEGVETN